MKSYELIAGEVVSLKWSERAWKIFGGRYITFSDGSAPGRSHRVTPCALRYLPAGDGHEPARVYERVSGYAITRYD